MKKLLALIMCAGLVGCSAGCADDTYYGDPPAVAGVSNGSVEFCDDWGCRMVDAPYYYSNGELFYWDVGFGAWIGPRGYWNGGWHRGFVPGYHERYRVEHYHSFREGFHGGGGFHNGGGHMGRGHSGGHGGHGGH